VLPPAEVRQRNAAIEASPDLPVARINDLEHLFNVERESCPLNFVLGESHARFSE
jgi:hypothetical protein